MENKNLIKNSGRKLKGGKHPWMSDTFDKVTGRNSTKPGKAFDVRLVQFRKQMQHRRVLV